MTLKKLRLTIVLSATALAMTVTNVANAMVVSEHGDDFAHDYNHSTQVRVCDREDDENSVYASYQRSGSGNIDTTARTPYGTCTNSGEGARIYRLRVCEHLGWTGSRCGNNVYP